MTDSESIARSGFSAPDSAPVHGKLLIDGDWVEALSGEDFNVLNPADERIVGSAAAAGNADVDRAVAAARAAIERGEWGRMGPGARARILFRIADLLDECSDRLVETEVKENGMPMPLAQWVVQNCVDIFRYYGGWITKIHGLTSDIGAGPDFHAYTLRQPVGVVALIVPWNGPLLMACQKVAPALAAGCACILKPAEDTPLNALELGRITLEAGVPRGMLNVLTGVGATVGAALANHHDIDKVSFTGSAQVGREIVRAAAGNLKRVSLELGGKSPVLVLDDADLDAAVPAVLNGIMANSGQICTAGSRLYVQRGVYHSMIERLAEAAGQLKLGSGFDAQTHLGPVISDRHMRNILDHIKTGIAEGARLVTGGTRYGEQGYFVQPTILAEPRHDARVVQEEIFGPVLTAVPFDSLEDAVALANGTDYGLAGAIYTENLGNAHRLAKQIRGGNIFINCHGIYDPAMPFGGFGQSGWGRELGKEGLDAFLETKSVFARL